MTAETVFSMGLVNDNTIVYIRQGEGFQTLARGGWYNDEILAYEEYKVESFTWQDDNRIYIDIHV